MSRDPIPERTFAHPELPRDGAHIPAMRREEISDRLAFELDHGATDATFDAHAISRSSVTGVALRFTMYSRQGSTS